MLNDLFDKASGLLSLINTGHWKTDTVPKHSPVDVMFTKKCKINFKSIDSQKEEVVKLLRL